MNYGSPSYWDERYAAIGDKGDQHNYDWYASWPALQKVVRPLLRKKSAIESFEILIPGCGSSTLGSQLYHEGYTNITNVDSSSVVINQMSDLYHDLDQMEFTCMDACAMEFIPDNCFDLIIDKALFDCQLCNSANMTTVTRLVREMYRVLKPGGTYVMVSHGPPDTRVGFLVGDSQEPASVGTGTGVSAMKWTITHDEIPKPPINDKVEVAADKFFYVYKCKKDL